jgi:hypothetical protein
MQKKGLSDRVGDRVVTSRMSPTQRRKILAFMAGDTPPAKNANRVVIHLPRVVKIPIWTLWPVTLSPEPYYIYINYLRGDRGVSLGCHRVSPMKPRSRENDTG